MTITTKEIITKRIVYVCGKGHNHHDYDVAVRCDERNVSRAKPFAPIQDRVRRAGELREQGKTFKEIGQIVGRADDASKPVSAAIARQLYGKYQRGYHLRPCSGLSTWANNVLLSAGVKNMEKQEVKQLVESGKIRCGLTKNCGPAIMSEIIQWIDNG